MTKPPRTEIVGPATARQADVLDPSALPEVGQWCWDTIEEKEFGKRHDDSGFACITCVGSNYVELKSVGGSTWRIHLDDLAERIRLEPNPDQVIAAHINKHQDAVRELMAEVQQVTARLGIVPAGVLPAAAETSALARVSAGGADFSTYSSSLAKAKTETLPALFNKIEKEHAHLATWMKVQTIPLLAQTAGMKSVIGRIEARIFNVELYAGLAEQIVQVTDGEPAELTEKVRLFQRRAYMDEEALLDYQTGGMDFSSIERFDAWMAKPENRDRLLPFPRCIVSFQVRRYQKARASFGSFLQLFETMDQIQADKLTFLYIRNGDQLYRMATALDFGGTLFPHFTHDILHGRIWAKMFCDRVDHMLSDDEYHECCREYDAAKAEYEVKAAQHRRDLAAWKKAKAEAKARGEKFEEQEPWDQPWFHRDDPREEFVPFEPGCVYYDDIKRKIDADIEHHNRIVLVLQGLLDRSPILQPHPPWRLWTEEGMTTGIELIFDDSLALVAGDPPNFEAYRAQCNALLAPGSITVGQQEAWERQQAELHREKYPREYRVERHRPYGNPGPGELAVVTAYAKKKGECSYAWEREALGRGRWDEKVRATCAVPASVSGWIR